MTIIFYTTPYLILNNSEYFKKNKLKMNSKNAFKNSIKSLKSSYKSHNNAYTEIHKILNNYISLKININIERSTEEIFNIFNENCSNKIVLDDLKSMLKKIDAVRFSNIQSTDYKRDINSFQKLLKKLDSGW